MQDGDSLTPGFMVVHGNQMEQLRDVLVQWTRMHPLRPLEQEVVLVQSNGMAQWLRQALAADSGLGIAASLQVSLPARFIWQAYRAVLKEDAIADSSPLDKDNLVWRLMRLLPELLVRPRFVPLRGFLGNDRQLRKQYQLCQRIADILDQYQVYRADWLADWAQGNDRIGEGGQLLQLEEGQQAAGMQVRLQTLAWQAELWRELLDDIGAQALAGSRASVHPRFIAALQRLEQRPAGLPRRVIVFGISSLPAQTLEALAAMARFSQVILCVHNPCRYYWGDIVADRDLLRPTLVRHQRRASMPAELDEQDLHQHAHPLLAAWGKQGRDYIALLQEHDNRDSYEAHFAEHKQQIDLFHEEETDSLLRQLQSDILNLEPLQDSREHWKNTPVDPARDESIRFHSAHSPQREVEILHDQLLDRFARYPQLQPRDVIVMVPDIDRYAPHIQAVFGQFERDDPRFLPFAVSDQGRRGQEPLLIALELLLQLPELRMTRNHMLALLDVPALRNRFGVQEGDLPLLQRWMEGAGIRWGLDAGQREALGAGSGLQQNTWGFGLERMLAGYILGQDGTLDAIESYAEVAGLEAAALGPLYLLHQALLQLEHELRKSRCVEDWVSLFGRLLSDFLAPLQQTEQLLVDQLQQALESWQKACEQAGFAEELPLLIAREAWLGGLETGRDSQRFLAGAISFCTLMPMRSIPFRMVCLLGMNDGDYPRIQPPLDFDLMAGNYRPGDRSRREDDRYLMLEALLAARQMLHVSWVGRDVQDNSECTPSVLVAQLRDHLAQGWSCSNGQPLDEALTTVHPLQPFSRAYFDRQQPELFTYAAEWQALHVPPGVQRDTDVALPPLEQDEPLTADQLFRFVRRPVEQFFAQRFKVYLRPQGELLVDDEPFSLDALQTHGLKAALLHAGSADDSAPLAAMHAEAKRMQRSGELPVQEFGSQLVDELVDLLQVQLTAYKTRMAGLSEAEGTILPLDMPAEPVQADDAGLTGQTLSCDDVQDGMIPGLRARPGGLHLDGEDMAVRPQLAIGALKKGPNWRWSRLLRPLFDHVLLHAAGGSASTEIYGEDGWARVPPMEREDAMQQLRLWLQLWCEGMRRPLPVAFDTAMAWLEERGKGKTEEQCREAARKVYESGYQYMGEGEREVVLRREYPEFTTLLKAGFESCCEPFYQVLLDLEPAFEAYRQTEDRT